MSRLHHLALGSANIERLADFYGGLLGLPEVSRQAAPDGTLRSIWLDLGGSILMLERDSSTPRAVVERAAGLFLLALRVTPQELKALEERAARAGHGVESRTAFTSYLRDPDGNRVGLSHYPDPRL